MNTDGGTIEAASLQLKPCVIAVAPLCYSFCVP